MDNCCGSMMKYVVFLFNFLFFCTGVALVGLGAAIQINAGKYFDFMSDSYSTSSMIIIIVGVVIFVVAFFGCCGACTESSCMMRTYGVLLAIILIAEVSVAVALFVYKGDAEIEISKNMKTDMEQYGPDNEAITKAWDVLQSDFKCCGVNDYKDWLDVAYGKIPISCCKHAEEGCSDDSPNLEENIYVKGCLDKLKDTITSNATVVGGVGLGVAFFQFIGIVIACCLAKNMSYKNNYV